MRSHRNPESRVSNKAHVDNFDPGDALEQLYAELVEVEALAHAAGEAITSLPTTTSPKQRRLHARVYALVTKTAGEARAALTLSENLVSALSVHMANPTAGREHDIRRRQS